MASPDYVSWSRYDMLRALKKACHYLDVLAADLPGCSYCGAKLEPGRAFTHQPECEVGQFLASLPPK